MMISTRGRYALRVMIDLAENAGEGYLPLRDIAARQGISLKYLEQIIALLHKAGFLRSLRGNSGGYRLKLPPEEYTAGDILRAAEGTLAPISCLDVGCERSDSCRTLPFWQDYYRTVNNYVDGVTLADLVSQAQEKRGANA